VLVPDLTGWRLERLPRLPDQAYFTLAPDWVCEVLSPSTERIDRVKKLAIYARQGVRHAWLLNPGNRTLEVLRFEASR
jgi:Uma2 family endonuclease